MTEYHKRRIRNAIRREVKELEAEGRPTLEAKAQVHAWTVKRVLVIIATTLAMCSALAFASFIFEESCQTLGFSVKAAMDAKDLNTARTCLERLEATQKAASAWQHSFGRLCFWMHGSYIAFFDVATKAQCQAYRRLIESKEEAPTQWSEPKEIAQTNVVNNVGWIQTPIGMQAKIVETNAPITMQTATPTQQFWTQWRSNKWAMIQRGYQVSKTNGQWIVTKINHPIPTKMAK